MSDRSQWLRESCPVCGARPGLRCRTHRYEGKPAGSLHGGRGWRWRSCPKCKAPPGEMCRTPTGRTATDPHTARLQFGRQELGILNDIWQELERWQAVAALVRFSGGGGRPPNIAAITLEDADTDELARWSFPEGELPDALSAPIWGRYATFRGHPHIAATVLWNVEHHEVLVAGNRGGERFSEVLIPRPLQRVTLTPPNDTSRDVSAPVAPSITTRTCELCAGAIATHARSEARYCSKRCRQAASRQRLRERSGRAGLTAPEHCTWCNGPMPAGLRPEARYCSKRCRQAASRQRLAVRPHTTPIHDTSRDTSPPPAPS